MGKGTSPLSCNVPAGPNDPLEIGRMKAGIGQWAAANSCRGGAPATFWLRGGRGVSTKSNVFLRLMLPCKYFTVLQI